VIGYFGSEDRATEGLMASRRCRLACCAWTRLPTLGIDTSALEWDDYAQRIAAFCAP
jgi:hypothetical protein